VGSLGGNARPFLHNAGRRPALPVMNCLVPAEHLFEVRCFGVVSGADGGFVISQKG